MDNLVTIMNAGWTPPVDLTQPKYRKVQWYKAVRLEFIGYTLAARGVVYPRELVERFGVSITQARNDIEFWQEINHGLTMQGRKNSYEHNCYSLPPSKKNTVAMDMNCPAII